MTCDQFVLAADGWSKVDKLPRTVFTSLRLLMATPFEVLRKIKMFNNETDLTAGISKDFENGFTATLNFPKIEVVLNLL